MTVQLGIVYSRSTQMVWSSMTRLVNLQTGVHMIEVLTGSANA